ncbi:hypothetical protein B296_00020343 [Ensete ventricosum]|uniref:Uncharacterized protein n=1 Tax=Ensete ventricosum TaxID=4639 RepID=A0A426ZLJ3_ENSVE|nr:hypothetical protein B296_00020343 [Ensete ventricosum]
MMHHSHGLSNQTCRLIAVLCGKFTGKRNEVKQQHPYPFPELVSSGHLEVGIFFEVHIIVHTLVNPSVDSFREAQRSLKPNILFIWRSPMVKKSHKHYTQRWNAIKNYTIACMFF